MTPCRGKFLTAPFCTEPVSTPDTTYARLVWLPTYSNRSGGTSAHPDTGTSHKTWFTGVTMRHVPLASQKEITSGGASGSKEIKVPQVNHDTGTVSLVAASQSVTEA